jgi:hypothetical protein
VNALVSLEEASALVAGGRPLLIAGDEGLLAALPRGRWLGGTIPYFMTEAGGVRTSEQLFVTGFPDFIAEAEVVFYGPGSLSRIPADYPERGVSFLILPASSQALVEFAQQGPGWKGLFDRPLVGWVAGVDLAQLGKVAPRVFNGLSGESSTTSAGVMHLALPRGRAATVDLINLFSPGDGDALTFPRDGFEVTDVVVNGRLQNFAAYLERTSADTTLPLVADYHGAMVNLSFQCVDRFAGRVTLYAPVATGVTYRLARPLTEDYAVAFQRELERRTTAPAFACNCILNYVHGRLEGKRTGGMVGPITFGEVAYMLLNQTLVTVDFT